MKDTLKVRGLISLKVTDKDGNLKDERLIKNTITKRELPALKHISKYLEKFIKDLTI